MTVPADDEGALIAACVRGERAAERALFRREYPRVNATVYRILGTTHETDDLVQDTFIAVFRALPKFRAESKLSTWIDRIAVRIVFQHIATRRRATLVPLESIPDPDDRIGPLADRIHAREGLRRLYEALGDMKPEARTAFALYAIDGRSIAEVAALTETSAIVAKVRIWRARRELLRRAAGDPVLAQFIGEQEDP